MVDIRMKNALRRVSAALGVMGLVAFVAACGDSDLFGGDNNTQTDPPEITTFEGPATIRAGETLFLDIVAEGTRPIEEIELTITTGATSRDTTVEVTAALTIDETLEIDMPATLSGTTVEVTARAVDDRGTRSEPESISISVEDSDAPSVEILRPTGPLQAGGDTTAVGTGAAVRVEAHVSDPSGISEVRFIGLALRGDPDLGTDTIVTRFAERVVTFPRPGVDTLPTDTIIRRDLPQLGDSTEAVLIIVEATDLFGNVTSDTVPVIVGGPDVQILRPTDGSTHNQATDLTIRVAISDPGGIESATLTITGAANQSVPLGITGLPTTDTITYVLQSSQITGTGALTISASAANARGITAPGTPVTVTVVAGGTAEANDPTVEFTIDPLPRLSAPITRREMLDTITIRASADDQGGSGVTQLVIFVDAIINDGQDTAHIEYIRNYATPRSNPDTTVQIAVQDLYDDISSTLAASVALPDSIDLRVTVQATDAAGNANTSESPSNGFGTRGYILTVSGFTANLPGLGIISDAVIDPTPGDERLFLSNFTQSRVDVLDLRDSTFVDEVLAGAQPWGLFIDMTGDTLIVANSGGTNLSKVDLRDPALNEIVGERVHTPETVIYQFTREIDEQLAPRYSYLFQGYSDRPQFVAQGISGSLLYSTVPTPEAEDGTIRLAIKEPGWDEYEDYLLFPGGDPSNEEQSESFLILNVDRAMVIATDTGDLIRIIDHVPGFPSLEIDVVGSELTAFTQAWAAGSDVVKCAGGLNTSAVGLQDTTFVSASGDNAWIAFGEGATEDAGRIIMLDGSITEPLDSLCLATGQSHEVQIADLIDNAAERVTGLGLNQNGTLGVARGDFAAYYFDRSLRLEGTYDEDINPGGFGAALHPDHNTESAGSSDETLSFVGTAESTIKIIDTYHFFARGEVPIRDPIVGPLRATQPIPGFDNIGLVCPGDPRCVVVKLFGVTQSAGSTRPDGVVIVDVRERDID